MVKEVEFYVPIAVVCCDNLCLIVSRHTRCQKGVQEYKLNVKDIKIHLIGAHLLVALFLLSFSVHVLFTCKLSGDCQKCDKSPQHYSTN